MGTTHEGRIADMAQCAFKNTVNADAIQLGSDPYRSSVATAANFGQPFDRRQLAGSMPRPTMCSVWSRRNRHLHARHKTQPEVRRGGAGFGQAQEFVVIGQGQQIDTVGVGAANHGGKVPSEAVEWQCRSALSAFMIPQTTRMPRWSGAASPGWS